jgi:hypothetical protein
MYEYTHNQINKKEKTISWVSPPLYGLPGGYIYPNVVVLSFFFRSFSGILAVHDVKPWLTSSGEFFHHIY